MKKRERQGKKDRDDLVNGGKTRGKTRREGVRKSK